MSAIKEQMAEVIRKQPDDASYEEIMRELAFEQTITRGLDDSWQGRVISNEELKRRIGEWQSGSGFRPRRGAAARTPTPGSPRGPSRLKPLPQRRCATFMVSRPPGSLVT